ncbi:MAG: arsenate reductase ArsC [Spirochaetota bacterium]|nr:arsenate reductase ArsC [Spirochaetota bacterium]
MEKTRILAICIHNSARSQMTEEYLRLFGSDIVEAESAGIEPGTVNPFVVELLLEDGIDISGKQTKSVADLHSKGKSYDYVIAVCDPEAAEACPIFPSEKKRIHWPFPDPSRATGTRAEKLDYVRGIRNQIRTSVLQFLDDLRKGTI